MFNHRVFARKFFAAFRRDFIRVFAVPDIQIFGGCMMILSGCYSWKIGGGVFRVVSWKIIKKCRH